MSSILLAKEIKILKKTSKTFKWIPSRLYKGSGFTLRLYSFRSYVQRGVLLVVGFVVFVGFVCVCGLWGLRGVRVLVDKKEIKS